MRKLFTCLYPLKFQAYPTRDQRPAFPSRVSGHDSVYLQQHWEQDVAPWCDGWSNRSFMLDPLSYFSYQPVPHDWCNKGHSMYSPVCGIMHIKYLFLLIGKNSTCSDAVGFLSCYLNDPLLYVRRHITVKYNLLRESLNKPFPFFLKVKIEWEYLIQIYHCLYN